MSLSVEEKLILEEGLSLSTYKDTRGNMTIGVGHKIKSDWGTITLKLAGELLEEDIKDCLKYLRNFSFFGELDSERQYVLISMCFNLGFKGLQGFKKMLLALENHNYSIAADEMLDSLWHRQLPIRSEHLAEVMRTGKW